MDSERVIRTCLEARIPVIATGPPGTGKTGWGFSLENEGWSIIQVVASVREATDIGGWPMRTENGVSLEPGAWAKEAMDRDMNGERVIVMFDEMRTVPAPTQAALLKVIHEHYVGDTQLPRSITFLAFANSVDESAGGVPLEPPMANRFVHVPWTLNYKTWCEAMMLNEYATQSKLSEKGLERLPAERAAIAGFIGNRSQLLLDVPKDEEKRDGAWPSPRTWDYAAHLWASAGNIDNGFREELLAACVGLPAAGEYIRWRDAADLLDPEAVIKGEYEKKVGSRTLKLVDQERPDRTYAILSSVVAAVAADWTDKRYIGAWKAQAKAADDGAGDMAAAMVGPLLKTAIGKKNVPSVAKYAMAFLDLLKRAGLQVP